MSISKKSRQSLRIVREKEEEKRKLKAELPGLQSLWDAEPPKTVQGRSGIVYRRLSCFCLRPSMEPRRSLIRLVETVWFDRLILGAIMANLTMMACDSPMDPPGTWKAAVMDWAELLFLALFTFELIFLVIARGFVMHKGAYLRDPWCQLDFIIVTLAWVPIMFSDTNSFTAIRAVRALRPLRSLKRLPGMPVLVESVLKTIPKLGNVVMLCFFLLLVWAILGVEIFKV